MSLGHVLVAEAEYNGYFCNINIFSVEKIRMLKKSQIHHKPINM
jgi:uncharacterized protein YqfB (UPF0267 family)